MKKIALLLLCAVSCFAQGGESTAILGLVEDSTGSVVPGVEITATHIATGQVRKVTTGESGTYVFSLMPPGEYTVRAEKSGFRPEVRSGLQVQLNQRARVNFARRRGKY
jgi:hypothetical protein